MLDLPLDLSSRIPSVILDLVGGCPTSKDRIRIFSNSRRALVISAVVAKMCSRPSGARCSSEASRPESSVVGCPVRGSGGGGGSAGTSDSAACVS
eukprot:7565177-Pyramimonas_sp.AAC.1